ncbi:MAG: pilus assembly protein PilZ [Pseudomonadales bacterium]|nr:pilus assembly protein PilZ [Pseudomonadales bacterium]
MPFLKCGGIFIPTNKTYEVGNEVFMLLKLLEEPEKIPVAGTVVWVTPARAQGTRVRGIGIQFNDPEGAAKAKIENVLAGQLDSATPTHTM